MTDAQPEQIQMQATAYCDGTKTATGMRVREGMCAGKREWFYKCAAVYVRNADGSLGKFVGYYYITDTGGKPIRQGKVLDIYMKSRSRCYEFGRKKITAIIIDGKG